MPDFGDEMGDKVIQLGESMSRSVGNSAWNVTKKAAGTSAKALGKAIGVLKPEQNQTVEALNNLTESFTAAISKMTEYHGNDDGVAFTSSAPILTQAENGDSVLVFGHEQLDDIATRAHFDDKQQLGDLINSELSGNDICYDLQWRENGDLQITYPQSEQQKIQDALVNSQTRIADSQKQTELSGIRAEVNKRTAEITHGNPNKQAQRSLTDRIAAFKRKSAEKKAEKTRQKMRQNNPFGTPPVK